MSPTKVLISLLQPSIFLRVDGYQCLVVREFPPSVFFVGEKTLPHSGKTVHSWKNKLKFVGCLL